MKKLLLGCAAALAIAGFGSGAQATTVLFDFSLAPHQNNVGTTETYIVGGLSLFASGFNWTGGAADLYGKHGGGDENGLGLANDPTNDNEIHYHSGYVQIDVSGLIGHVLANSVTFGTNSTTDGEQWTVYGSNQAGGTCGVNPLCGTTFLVSGTSEAINQALPNFGTYRYYDFVETSHTVGTGDNFLLTNIAAQAVPEPTAWALMLMGFGGLGAVLRRRRAMVAA